MKDDGIRFATTIPQISKTGNSIYGGTFEIFEVKNGRLISSIDAVSGESNKIASSKNISDNIMKSYSGVRKWGGTTYYYVAESMAEVISWKYTKVAELFAFVDDIAANTLKRNAKRKEQVGFHIIEDKYPELVL